MTPESGSAPRVRGTVVPFQGCDRVRLDINTQLTQSLLRDHTPPYPAVSFLKPLPAPTGRGLLLFELIRTKGLLGSDSNSSIFR
jgi:hypothetical protein